ncbi:LPD7 domain-containing protein [Povalibacter sp.]|uniref:LPD7 domain-containing protein n=1 Tax=Povalibacter sp. TaxID=1962978 RepID=UPI002F3FFECC
MTHDPSSGDPDTQTRRRKAKRAAENAIRWERPAEAPQVRESDGKKSSSNSSKSAEAVRDASTAVPSMVRSHFVQVGRDYYFSDGARAFSDRAVKLTTPSENTQVIRDLVAIAQARGWQRIVVSGTQRFRKEAWVAAREAGLEVKGFRASEVDEARLVRRLGTDSVREEKGSRGKERSDDVAQAREAKSSAPAKPREHVGRLIEHGPAPYQHDPHEPMSYFVKLETSRGEKELWGVDLDRAFRESLSRPKTGDEVVVRAVKQEPVTVRSRREVDDGPAIEKEVATHRNRWVVEQRQFLEEREKAAQVLRNPSVAAAQGSREHPELVGAYLQVHAAELAAKQFRDPQDQKKFVALVRAAIADSVQRGEALPAVRLRQSESERRVAERGAGAIAERERTGRARER